jgi:hypothetical protein
MTSLLNDDTTNVRLVDTAILRGIDPLSMTSRALVDHMFTGVPTTPHLTLHIDALITMDAPSILSLRRITIKTMLSSAAPDYVEQIHAALCALRDRQQQHDLIRRRTGDKALLQA